MFSKPLVHWPGNYLVLINSWRSGVLVLHLHLVEAVLLMGQMQERAKKVKFWHTETMEKRSAVHCEDLTIQPWTNRDYIHLRGCMGQEQPYNFLWETINTRWMYLCFVRNLCWLTALRVFQSPEIAPT